MHIKRRGGAQRGPPRVKTSLYVLWLSGNIIEFIVKLSFII